MAYYHVLGFALWIIPVLIFYGIVIARTKGRCSRGEYLIKGLLSFAALSLGIVIFVALQPFAFFIPFFPLFSFTMMIVVWVAAYFYSKYTIQRLYDLGMSWYFLLLTLVPVAGLVLTILLFAKKAGVAPNEYDAPIKYRSICKGKDLLDIHEDKLFFNSVEFRTEYHLGKYNIRLSSYAEKNRFAEYLLANYPSREDYIARREFVHNLVVLSGNDLLETIKTLDLIVMYESRYIKIMGYKLFIRSYNFGYDIIINKEDHQATKEMIDAFDFPGSYSEDENYIYYRKVPKEKLKTWVKNAA